MKTIRIAMLVWCGISLVVQPTDARTGADHCDEGLLELSSGVRGYQLRGGHRCEGEYAQQVNSGLLEIGSLTMGKVSFDLAAEGDLWLRWERPPKTEANLRLRGSSLLDGQYYRMDAAVPSAQTAFEWPLDIIANLDVQRRDLGVSAWVSPSSDARVYVPVAVGQGGLPPQSMELHLRLIANYEVLSFTVSVVRATWPGSIPEVPEVVEQRPLEDFGFAAKQPIDIALTRPSSSGMYAVEIGFDYEDNTTGAAVPGTDSFFFYIGDPGATSQTVATHD